MAGFDDEGGDYLVEEGDGGGERLGLVAKGGEEAFYCGGLCKLCKLREGARRDCEAGSG